MIIETEEMKSFIWGILRGNRTNAEICRVIEEAVNYPKKIPNSFWKDENKGYYGFFDEKRVFSKDEMRGLKMQIVEAVVAEINNPSQDVMYSDHYTRLFHILAIFKVPKCLRCIPAHTKNYMYNISYDLWALDDGSKEAYMYIDGIAWYAAEAFKTGKLECEDMVEGGRHLTFGD